MTMHSDVSYLISSLQETPEGNYPFRHWLIPSLFDENMVDELLNLDFRESHLSYQLGTREEHNSSRQYINQEAIGVSPVCKRLADLFLDERVIAQFEEMGGMSLKNTLLRFEYAVDTKGFWLTPHTDIGVKCFTMLIYLSKDEGSETWGTDIYENADKHAMAVPFKSNTALMFIPSNKTWHGFEARDINGVRKSIIVNYVTEDWRNRHELVHPTKVVY